MWVHPSPFKYFSLFKLYLIKVNILQNNLSECLASYWRWKPVMIERIIIWATAKSFFFLKIIRFCQYYFFKSSNSWYRNPGQILNFHFFCTWKMHIHRKGLIWVWSVKCNWKRDGSFGLPHHLLSVWRHMRVVVAMA